MWVYPISALLLLPLELVCIASRLLIKQTCLHVGWKKEEDTRLLVKFRDVYQIDERELQHQTDIINQEDEKFL